MRGLSSFNMLAPCSQGSSATRLPLGRLLFPQYSAVYFQSSRLQTREERLQPRAKQGSLSYCSKSRILTHNTQEKGYCSQLQKHLTILKAHLFSKKLLTGWQSFRYSDLEDFSYKWRPLSIEIHLHQGKPNLGSYCEKTAQIQTSSQRLHRGQHSQEKDQRWRPLHFFLCFLQCCW